MNEPLFIKKACLAAVSQVRLQHLIIRRQHSVRPVSGETATPVVNPSATSDSSSWRGM